MLGEGGMGPAAGTLCSDGVKVGKHLSLVGDGGNKQPLCRAHITRVKAFLLSQHQMGNWGPRQAQGYCERNKENLTLSLPSASLSFTGTVGMTYLVELDPGSDL